MQIPVLCFSQYDVYFSAGPTYSAPFSYKSEYISDFSWGFSSSSSIYDKDEEFCLYLSYSNFSSFVRAKGENFPSFEKKAQQKYHAISFSLFKEFFRLKQNRGAFSSSVGLGVSSFFYARTKVNGWKVYRKYDPNLPVQYVYKRKNIDDVIESTDFSRLLPSISLNFRYSHLFKGRLFFLRPGVDFYPYFDFIPGISSSSQSAFMNLNIQIGFRIFKS